MDKMEAYLAAVKYDATPAGMIVRFRDIVSLLPDRPQPFDSFFAEEKNFRPTRPDLLEEGPARYIRFHLRYLHDEDRARVREDARIARVAMDEIDRAMGAIEAVLHFCQMERAHQALTDSIRTPFTWESAMQLRARSKGYWKNLKSLEGAFGALVALRNIAREKVEACRTDPFRMSEKQFWKHDFVRYIAELWRNLFSEYPSVAPDSRFADLLACIWEAIDPENRFPQNWERTIREVVGELKAA